MAVLHPTALRDGGALPGACAVGTAEYAVDSEGYVECPADAEADVAEVLADAHGCEAEDLLESDDDLEAGDTVCTCDPGDACDGCGGDCPTVKHDGEVCGSDRPCPYHDDEDE